MQPAEQDVLDAVMQWKQRRRPPITESEVALSVRDLAAPGRIHLKPSPDLPLPREALFDV